jgi:integrase/recombinase XerD
MKRPTKSDVVLAPMLQRFFLSYLTGQRNVSQQTIWAYRDTFRLLLRFLQRQYRLQPESLKVADLNVTRIIAFLDDLERTRANCPRSRNARLAGIRSFMRFASSEEPALLATTQHVLGIPSKRHDRRAIGHLTREQMQALIDASGGTSPSCRRDQLLLLLLYNTGARVSELAGLKVSDVSMAPNASARFTGKGRKQRTVPLWRQTVRLLKPWLQRPGLQSDSPVLPNARGQPMTRYGVAQPLRWILTCAAKRNPPLKELHLTPHVIRHTTAMHLLQSGVDLSVIALWLGHENIQTTHGYLAADLEMKKQALSCLRHPRVQRTRTAPVPMLDFLSSL